MIVDLLYFEGCPNHERARQLVRSILEENGIAADIREIEVADAGEAQAQKFLGSPTVRVDGVDVDPAARMLTEFGMMCRLYRAGDSRSGIPMRSMIENALRNSVAEQRKSQ